MANLYQPNVRIFYGPTDSDHRLIPAPNISISLEYNYSNDTIIGYSYIVNIKGTVTALDLRDLDYNDEIPEPNKNNIGALIDHIYKLRKILTQNGNILHVLKGADDTLILKAKGGILRSFSIDDSNNNWMRSVSYSASIEFHSIDLNSYTENCSSLFLDPLTYNTNGIVDINKYKIKSFNDSWAFNFDENDSFNKVKTNDVGTYLNIDNNSFNIEYTISAIGKHFFDYDDETTGESKLLPAWEQAKNFVQYRLYNQVTNLISNVLKDSYADACTSSDGLNDILEPGAASGLLKNIGNDYQIYNEQITCDTSEAEGSFSATYSAIVKTLKGNNNWSSPSTKHTVSKSVQTTNTNGVPILSITVNGTIEGLIEGGLIRINQPLQLPVKGSFIIYNAGANTKYSNANSLLSQIYSDSDYSGGIGEYGKRDLRAPYKDALGITLMSLNMSQSPNDTIPNPPHPTNFNLTHDYNAGIINYTVEYSNSKFCGRKFNDITIQTNKPNKVIAVFNIPNSNSCPTVQQLGTYSAQTVELTVQGVDLSEYGLPTELDLVNEITKEFYGCYENPYLPFLPPEGTYIITQQRYTKNPINGSFTMNISYTCTEGCGI